MPNLYNKTPLASLEDVNMRGWSHDDYAEFYAESKSRFEEQWYQRERSFVSTERLGDEAKAKNQYVMKMLAALPKEVLILKRNELLKTQIRGQAFVKDAVSGKSVIGDVVVDSFNLDYMIAETLQSLYSSEDPRAEYYDWVNAFDKIKSDIYTDGTTPDEISARNAFIGFMDDRETEMKRVMALYAGAAIHGQGYYREQAQAKLDFMKFKLSELRRLRTKMENTKSYADEDKIIEKRNPRIRDTGAEVLTAATVTAVAAEALTKGERYAIYKAGLHSHEFENDVAHHMGVVHPELYEKAQVEERVGKMRENKRKTAKLILGLQMGKSAAEQAAEEQYASSGNLRRYHGFQMQNFQNLERQRSA